MQAAVDPAHVLRCSAERSASATLELAGLRCSTHVAAYSGTGEGEVSLPRHLLRVAIGGEVDHVVEERWDGHRHRPRVRRGVANEALFVPQGRSWAVSGKGSFSIRYLSCEIEPSTFEAVLGTVTERYELRPHSGPSPIAPGLAERLAAACEAPGEMPRAYNEALATMLVVELFRGCASKPLNLNLSENAGTTRFDIVRDFIEDSLGENISLFELAGLVSLSPAQFDAAFRSAHRMSPERYILGRRIERAKVLLRNTDRAIGAVATAVGFSDEARFARTFLRLTRATPRAFRAG